MKVIKQNVGIDVSKKDLAVCLTFLYENLKVAVKGTKKFANNKTGFNEMLKWVERKKDSSLALHFSMEPTGVYHENLAYFLHDMNQFVHIILSNRAKKYAESLDKNSKTDKLDSKALGRMGVERELNLWNPGSPSYRKLKVLTRERSAVLKLRVMIKNQLEAITESAFPNKKSVNRLKRLINELNSQISMIEKDVERTVEKDMELKAKLLKIMTIPGIGFLTALIVIAETDGFALIKSIKQLVSYAGIDVRIRESGKWSGKSKISKSGNIHIRKALYWPAYTSIKYSSTYQTIYERIFERKEISLVAAVAIQRKLLGLIYTLWKNDSVFIDNYEKLKAA